MYKYRIVIVTKEDVFGKGGKDSSFYTTEKHLYSLINSNHDTKHF
jgi:hypothetical protein